MIPRRASPARPLLVAQALVAMAIVLAAMLVEGRGAAAAAMFGGLVVLVPTAYFAARMRMRNGAVHPAQALGDVYKAEVGKLLVTALMFVAGAKLFGAHYGWLMVACVACLAMNWVVLAFARSE